MSIAMTRAENTAGFHVQTSSGDAAWFLAGGLRDELGLEPETLEVGRLIAESHLRRGALREALRLYGALALCEPTNTEAQIGIAECAARLEIFDVGVGAATIAAECDPADPRAQLLLGRCRLALGDRDRGRRALETAAALGLDRGDPRSVEAARKMLAMLAADGGAVQAGADGW